MNKPYRGVMDHTGYLGNSRVVLNHFDVSTQADIQQVALSYESEDEIMGRLHSKKKGTPHYSKQDIREQYCISDRGLGALENERQNSLFGCLSSHQSSPCSNRTSFLTACVRQKVPSDENLYELHKRHPSEYAPYPRRASMFHRYPLPPLRPEMLSYDQELRSSYFRRMVPPDPSRYTWMSSDDESVRMEKPRSILEPYHSTPPSTLPGKKHVSFARSHTLTSFDDAISCLSSSSTTLNRMTRSQERLLEVGTLPITKQPEPTENIIMLDKIKRAPMKTQATQTEAALGRKPLPPSNINLSPRTMHRVKMVSQGAQTNGIILNGRKLMKSYSEAGSKFGLPPLHDFQQFETIMDHEPLARTQSDEPPRSPFIVTTPPPVLIPEVAAQSDTSSLSRSEDHESEDSAESKKEIFIDFKPQISPTQGKLVKRPLTKTKSDGEILIEQRKTQKVDDSVVPEKQITSFSHENIVAVEEEEIKPFTPYFQKSPIRHEGICRPLEDNVYSSLDQTIYGQDSIDEEFHENLIYNRLYYRQDSQECGNGVAIILEGHNSNGDEGVVPTFLLPDRRLSPFASNDSLANDIRDQSDGIWNESQATVLQVDSGTDNGTALSSSEMTSVTSPSAANLLTPSSRRKHLLMLQHQQRSSMDTEALDEEYVEQSEVYPRIVVEKSTPKQLEPPPPLTGKSYLSSQRAMSPSWRRKASETLAESPLPAIVPDMLLARTDSCKTNTDVSESTTTDDYITANSGTDSSRKSGSTMVNMLEGLDIYNLGPHINDGSFDSTKGLELLGDDMVVPSFSPPCSPSRSDRIDAHGSPLSRSITNTPVPRISKHLRTGRSTPSDDSSSSCGSYSVGGSTHDLLERSPVKVKSVPSKIHQAGSEDERSLHYSSSCYYESPMEDDLTWKSPKHDENHKRRPYTLDISLKQPQEPSYVSPTTKHKTIRRESKTSPRISPPTDQLKITEKPKRGKSRTRSPMQSHKKSLQSKKIAQFADERYKEESKATSDESSCDLGLKKYQITHHQLSPRKSKKNKENNRRKSLPRSPTSTRSSKRNGAEEKSSSLPGSLSRRKSTKQGKSLQPEDAHSISAGSPSSKKSSPQKSPDSSNKLKALSAESLRSVSPGSDSVFYSDPSSHTADHQVHCLHCGKEVDIVTTEDPDKSLSSNGIQHEIVQPPAGFEDSPRIKPQGRLYKKLDRRIRSEDRTQAEARRHNRYRQDVRAKSEERGAKTFRGKLRPMAKSTESSQEVLKATDSSPSVLPGAPESEDDHGVYDVPYNDGYWIIIDEKEEVNAWYRSVGSPDQQSEIKEPVSSTESEIEFERRYQSITHRMVHRKSCLEMYKRLNNKSLENGDLSENGHLSDNGQLSQKDLSDNEPSSENESFSENGHLSDPTSSDEEINLRNKLEEILKLMLVIWCRENKALNIISEKPSECDKTVVVHRSSGEFGFRIHGSKPVVVSAIEPCTPAETSGLEVGDIILAVNGVSVLDKNHSEVVKIAHAGSATLTLEVARTCYALNPPNEDHSSTSLYSGYLWKLSGYASGNISNKWIRRWFCLKQNNCLYYYKTDSEKQPVGVVMLFDHEIEKVNDDEGGLSKPHRFVIQRPDSVPLHLAADTSNAKNRWVEIISRAIADSQVVDEFLEETKRNLALSPSAVSNPDCFGYLVKLGTQWKSWNRRYCVLKDACLYFYQDANAKCAFGVAYLHGYRVQQSISGSKKHAFEILPPDSTKKHYYFHTESDADRKRWIAALEYSIDRWFKIQ